MGKYLLLRDNKESGPYLLDDLVRLGLKPYDLVWIEGKSAAWRYPSEINELKPYAPVAEEQPFDRFFKRSQEERPREQEEVKVEHQEVKVEQREIKREEKKPEAIVSHHSPYAPPVGQKEEVKFVPRKSVFVTLPNQKTKEPEKKLKIDRNEDPVRVSRQPSTVPTISITESPEVAEVKYSQPLEEIKEMYVRTLQQRKSKSVRRSILIANLKRAAVVIGLVLLGLLAGFLIKSKPRKPADIATKPVQNTQISPLQDASNVNFTDNSSQADDVVLNEKHNDRIERKGQEPEGNSNVETNEVQQPTTIRIRKETMLRPIEKKEQVIDEPARPGAETDAVTGERNRRVRGAVTNTNDLALTKLGKNRLKDLVSVSSNDYKRVAFGGIRNLYLTVTNNSAFELDHVIVELQYLKPSEEPLRTENIRFEAISPHTSATIKVPDTNRGIKVLYKIINIESKQSDDDVAGMLP